MKKFVIIIVGLIVGVLIGVGVYIRFFRQEVKNDNIANITLTPSEFDKLTTWEDQSEFSFQYPSTLDVNPHKEDETNYAHIELTSAKHVGSITLWCKDSKFWLLSDYLKSEEIEGAIDTTLGKKEAVKVITGEEKQKMTISTIRGGYLYQIEADLKDSEFWNRVMDIIVNSYTFQTTSEEASETSDGGSVGSYDTSAADIILEEEVIQ